MQNTQAKTNKALVNKIIPFSSVDGPGNRTVIFFQGCNFDCLYCHNPETINLCNNCGICIENCPRDALNKFNGKVKWIEDICVSCDKCIEVCEYDSSPKVKKISVEQILMEIKKNKPFISGITVSGGEALLQAEFLVELFYKTKQLGLSTFLDTNGSILLKDKTNLLKYLDKAMIDAKSYISVEHKKLTGSSNFNVIQNIKFMAKIGKLYEVRTVIVPNVLDNKYNVDKISKVLSKINPEIRYKLIKYRHIGVRTNRIKSHKPKDSFMKDLVNIASSNGCENVVLV